MNDKAKAKAIAEMVDRRRAAIRQKLWNEVALTLLQERGTLATEDVDDVVNGAMTEITDQHLADQIAQKTRAAIDYHRREIEMAEVAVDGARTKVEKFMGLVANAKEDLANLENELEATRDRLSDAEELAAYANELGDANAAPEPTDKSAAAGTATGEGGVN